MARHLQAALCALLAAAPPGAEAQFRGTPMVVRLPHPGMDVLPGQFAVSGGDGLLLLHQGLVQAELRPWHDLLRSAPSSFPVGWAASRRYRTGHLSQAGADALVDVAAPNLGAGVGVIFGSDPATVRTYGPATDTDSVASFLRLLPKPASGSGRVPAVLVVPAAITDPTFSRVIAIDFDGGAVPVANTLTWPTPGAMVPTSVGWHEAFPVRVSAAARAAGIDDVAVGVFGGVILLAHASAPATPALASVVFATPVLVGGWVAGLHPPWLPATAGAQADALGVTALDVDQDGAVDLVLTNATAFGVSPPAGSLLWVKGTGNPADFGDPTLTPWGDLGIDPALALVDPLIVRGLEIGGRASFAVWDRALQEVVVGTPDAGGLRVWRAPAPGQRAVDIHLADLVGSAEPELVVVMSNPASQDAVLVYPDLLDASPVLGWAPGSPGSPERGVDLPMAVDAADADGPAPRVDWMIGDPAGAPRAQGLAYTHPAAALCTLPPPPLVVTVRATDDLGVFTELSATLPVATPSPAISIASPGGRLVLAPGGATASLQGTIALVCGATATWGGSWPAGATVVDDPPQGSTVRRTVTLPEATYPDLLAAPTVVTLATSDPVPASTLTVDLDATGLVEVRHEADRPVLAEGDVAVLKTLVRSRIGVPLPLVRMVDFLAGLAPAGSPRVTGAALVEARRGGAEVVVDALPAAPAAVAIELPVSSLGGRGASAVEVRSSGGYLLTPAAGPPPTGEAPPGCGCGSAPGHALALLALVALRARSRAGARRRPAPPLT